jgi:hypothetical protein
MQASAHTTTNDASTIPAADNQASRPIRASAAFAFAVTFAVAVTFTTLAFAGPFAGTWPVFYNPSPVSVLPRALGTKLGSDMLLLVLLLLMLWHLLPRCRLPLLEPRA